MKAVGPPVSPGYADGPCFEYLRRQSTQERPPQNLLGRIAGGGLNARFRKVVGPGGRCNPCSPEFRPGQAGRLPWDCESLSTKIPQEVSSPIARDSGTGPAWGRAGQSMQMTHRPNSPPVFRCLPFPSGRHAMATLLHYRNYPNEMRDPSGNAYPFRRPARPLPVSIEKRFTNE